MTHHEDGPAAEERPAPRILPVLPARRAGPDLMLVLAMLAVTASYSLGYRLDWDQEASLSLAAGDEEEEGEAAATAAEAAAPEPPAPQSPAPVSASALPAGPAPTALAPAPTPAWTQRAGDAGWDRMTAELARAAARHPGRVGIVLKDLRTRRSWSYHPDELFPAASLIKVPVMIAAFYRITAGELSLRERFAVRQRTRVGGSGSLKWSPEGTRLTVQDLLIHMINESDNTATAMILETLGIGYVQQQFPRMGLLYSGIYPEGMSIRGGRVTHENYTTAREMTMLLEKIYRGEAVDRVSSALMLEILKRRKAVASRLAKGLPPGWEIAHKTGLLRMACHDSAIIFTPHGDYVITVLTGRNRSYASAKDFISHLGRITFTYYAGKEPVARGARRGRLSARR